MSEHVEEDSNQKNQNHNQLRTNLIKTKKNSLPHDREHLYAENLDLKSRLRDLSELNMKLKTQLAITEKEKVNLCQMAEEEAFNVRLGQRALSGNHKKSGTQLHPYQNHLQTSLNGNILKEVALTLPRNKTPPSKKSSASKPSRSKSSTTKTSASKRQ